MKDYENNLQFIHHLLLQPHLIHFHKINKMIHYYYHNHHHQFMLTFLTLLHLILIHFNYYLLHPIN